MHDSLVAFHVWVAGKFAKAILLKTIVLCFVFLTPALLIVNCAAQESVLILLSDYQWAHITIGSSPTESIRFEEIGVDLQIYFHAFNDSSILYDQFVIFPNQTFRDPLGLLSFRWNGTFTSDKKLLLDVQSTSLESLSVVVQKYEAGRPIIGHPPMTNVKSVITLAAENETQIYDVLLDDEWFVSFDWLWAVIENQTLPQLRLYGTEGTLRDTRLITAEMKPLVDYGGVDGVGWIPQVLTTQYIKWILYSGHEILVRPNTGFSAGKPLPFFAIDPAVPKVEPNQLVTIRFSLPQGVTNYTTNLEGYQKYLNKPGLKVEFDQQTQQYIMSFSFNNDGVGKYFTVSIQSMKHGIAYLNEIRLQVIAPAWQGLMWSIGMAAILLLVMCVAIVYMIKHRKPKLTSHEAFGLR